jgi:hypothetical protein
MTGCRPPVELLVVRKPTAAVGVEEWTMLKVLKEGQRRGEPWNGESRIERWRDP